MATDKPTSQQTQNERPAPQRPRPLLRRIDQASAAVVLGLALAAMGIYWFSQSGTNGRLIDIDRAEPRSVQFQIDINKAPWPELAMLPGIGETKARRIVAYREEKGPFVKHRDLTQVYGIGEKTLERIRPYLLPLPDPSNVAGP